MSWPLNRSEFGPNHTPTLIALSYLDGETVVPVAADPSSGALLFEAISTGSDLTNGQVTVSGTAAHLATTTPLSQGVTVQALSTNAVSVFVGKVGVTTSTGLELPAGASVTIPVNNLDLIYVICASGSPVVTYIGV